MDVRAVDACQCFATLFFQPAGFKGCKLSSIVLVSAVLASLAAGVLVAYATCQIFVSVFLMHARQRAKSPVTEIATSTPVIEG
jgi:hypothetical protein